MVPRRIRWLLQLGAFLACTLLFSPTATAQVMQRGDETDAEATYLLNFLRYTRWPRASFESSESPYVITVVGSEAVADRVRASARAAGRIDHRSILVRSMASPRGSIATPFDSQQDRLARTSLEQSHLVFFHRSAGPIHPQVMTDLESRPILTVSDSPGFTATGGMLGLIRSNGRLAFQANPGAIRHSKLLVSAKVLKLARRTRMASQ